MEVRIGTMIVYKVVKVDDSKKLVSCCVTGTLAIEYKPGKIALPKYGSLLSAFRSEYQARRFRGGLDYQVWKAEAVISRKRPRFIRGVLFGAMYHSDRRVRKMMTRIWATSHKDYVNYAIPMIAPEGTVMCKSVKLIEEIARRSHYLAS